MHRCAIRRDAKFTVVLQLHVADDDDRPTVVELRMTDERGEIGGPADRRLGRDGRQQKRRQIVRQRLTIAVT